MNSYFISIEVAVAFFFALSFLTIIPWLIYSSRKYGSVSIWQSIIVYSFIFYMLTALFLVILPMPSTRDTCSLQASGTVSYSLIPFMFIYEITHSSSVAWSQPSTYTQLLKHSAFIQASFNFLLLLPFGVYVRYLTPKLGQWKRALGLGFAVSLFFEVTQITGVYGIYNCPYRLFDVDDLILNSMGSLAGFLIAPTILSLFPSKQSVLERSLILKEEHRVLPMNQLLAVVADYFLIQLVYLTWSLVSGQSSMNGLVEFMIKALLFFIVYFVIPALWKGNTVGTIILRHTLRDKEGNSPEVKALLKRSGAIYLPFLISGLLNVMNGLEINLESPLYTVQIWMTILVFIVYGLI